MTSPLASAFDLVIFDWAGTMIDFGSRAPVLALVGAFAAKGVEVTEAQARVDMGMAKVDHVKAMLRNADVADAWRKVHGADPIDADAAEIMAVLRRPMLDAAKRSATLIPGAADTVAELRAAGLKIGSSTGYTREMMRPVLQRAAKQGYEPDHLVCAGDTAEGRPSPLMVFKACAELGAWPMSRVVKVDDAEVGVAEGRNAGCLTVGIAASGNTVGLTAEALAALDPVDRAERIALAGERLLDAGADLVIDTVADLVPALTAAAELRE